MSEETYVVEEVDILRKLARKGKVDPLPFIISHGYPQEIDIRIQTFSKIEVQGFDGSVESIHSDYYKTLMDKLREAINARVNGSPLVYENSSEITMDSVGTNERFTGREKYLAKIDDFFNEGAQLVHLSGIGGIGKSELAKEYARRNQIRFPSGGIIDASGSIRDLILKLPFKHNPQWDSMPEEDKYWINLDLLRKLSSDTLLILDDLTEDLDTKAMREFTYGLNCKILATSRKSSMRKYSFSVDEMDLEEAIELFRKTYTREKLSDDEIEKLVEAVGYHTMTIELMANILQNTSTKYEKLKDNTFEVRERCRHGGDDKAQTIYEHIKNLFSFGDLTEIENNILKFLSLLPQTGLPRERVAELLDVTESDINELGEKGFVRIDTQDNASLHPLISEVAYREIEIDYETKELFLSCIKELTDYDKVEEYSIKQQKKEIGGYYLEKRRLQDIEENTETADIYFNTGEIHLHLADYPKALEYYKKALEIRVKALGKEHSSVVDCMSDIGVAYDSQGEYSKALEYYEAVLEIKIKALGKEHPDVADCFNNIAVTYDKQGDYSNSLACYEIALEIKVKAFGEEHPDVANYFNNIAIIYDKQGDYPKALEYYEKAIDISIQEFGEEHPNVADCFNNIAVTYDNQGDCQKALEYYEKARKIRIKTLGEEHPDVATCLNNIGAVYINQGDCQKALEYYEKARKIRIKTLGEEHPDFATCLHNIGVVYRKQGEDKKALENFEKALNIYIGAFGKEHSYVANCLNNMGNVYRDLENYPKALENYEKALKIYIKVLGKKHLTVATILNNISIVYRKQGEHQKALEYYEKANAIRSQF